MSRLPVAARGRPAPTRAATGQSSMPTVSSVVIAPRQTSRSEGAVPPTPPPEEHRQRVAVSGPMDRVIAAPAPGTHRGSYLGPLSSLIPRHLRGVATGGPRRRRTSPSYTGRFIEDPASQLKLGGPSPLWRATRPRHGTDATLPAPTTATPTSPLAVPLQLGPLPGRDLPLAGGIPQAPTGRALG